MLMPKRTKHRKIHRGHRRGAAQRGSHIAFGTYGLQALEASWITNRQIESARRAMTRHVRRGGQIWIRIFPDHSYTKKPASIGPRASNWVQGLDLNQRSRFAGL